MRQSEPGMHHAGAGAPLRLDPFALPLRYHVADSHADGRMRTLDLFRERVVIRRTVAGARMKYQVPTQSYCGVLMKLMKPTAEGGAFALVMLAHNDPGLAVPLYRSDDATDALVECHMWARVLQLPVLIADFDGETAVLPDGALMTKPLSRRRRYGSAYLARRPLQLLRRKAGQRGERPIYRGEAEIIARN